MSMFGQPKPLASLSSTLLARKGHARPAMRPQGFGGFGSIPGSPDDLGWNDMGHPDDHPAEQAFAPPVAVPPVLRQREALHEEFEAPQEYGVPQEYEAPPAYAAPQEYEAPRAIEPEAAAYEPEAAYEAEAELEAEPDHEEPPVELVRKRVPRVDASAPVVDAAPVAAAPVPVIVPVSLTPVSLATAARIGRETQAKHGKAAFTLRLDHERHLRLRLASALHNCSAQVLVTEALDSFLQSLPEVEELARQLPPPRSKR